MALKRRRKKEKFDSKAKHTFTNQPCQLCGVPEEVDSSTSMHFCDRCTIQRAQGAITMPMLVSEVGECEKCGANTSQILRTMSKDKSKITEKFLCTDCYEVHEVEDKKNLPKSNRPAGWRFMKEIVDEDGTVYHIGVEQPELKGKLKPTDVVKVKASQKEKRKAKKQKKAERMAKKQAKLAIEYKKKMKKKEKEEQKKLESDRKAKFFEET
jgi:hypothetical protein